MYHPENIQDTSAPHGDHSRLNHIIVHSLYESGQLPHRVLLTSAIGSIHLVWTPAARYTVGIRSRKLTSHFTTPWIHSRTNCIIVHPLYGSVQLPGSGPLTSSIGSVYIKKISIAAYAAGVLSRNRTSHFTNPCMGITHVQTKLSYTRCKDAYSSLAAVSSCHPSHFTTPWVHSRANRIIVHPQYGSVQLPISGPLTSAIVSVHIKGISIAADAAGVRSRKCTSHFTTPCMGITHIQSALSCTRCTDMYSHSDAEALHQPCALYTS